MANRLQNGVRRLNAAPFSNLRAISHTQAAEISRIREGYLEAVSPHKRPHVGDANSRGKYSAGEEKLISFDEALKRCQDPNCMNMLVHSQTLVLSESQKDSIRRLKKELRNKMEHYVPSGWSIEIHGMPQIAIDVLDVIRFLSLQTGTYIHLNQAQMKKIKSSVFQSKQFLKRTKLYQEAQCAEGKSI